MTEEITNIDSNSSSGELNKGLNILTILTFIGSGLAAIDAIMGFTTIATSYETIKGSQGKLSELGDLGGGALNKMMADAGAIVEKSYEIVTLF